MTKNPAAYLGAALWITGIFAAPVFGEEVLLGTFWWEREPFVLNQEYPQTSGEALRHLLDESRWVFAAMIYGFRFTYTPGDSRRGIQTDYQLTLIEEIPWGRRNLKVVSAWEERSRFCADLAFELTGREAAFRDAWQSNVFPISGGFGEAPLYLGFESRRRAVEEAIRAAVYNYYRAQTAVRPREITGVVALQEVPSIIIREGNYRAQVRIKFNLELVRENLY